MNFKKMKSLLLVMAITVSTLFTGANAIFAVSEVQVTNLVATGYTHTGTANDGAGGSAWYVSQPIEAITLSNGTTGFCVEPWKLITERNHYIPTLTESISLSRIIYHGYENTAKSSYDYAVTQLMIWEQMGYYPTTNVPNYASRKNLINNLISTHTTIPSFHGQTISLNVGESITLTDRNDVISQFSTVQGAGMNISINGNQITFTATADTPTNATVTLNKYDTKFIGSSFMYNNAVSQKIYSGRLSDPSPTSINFDVTHIFGRIAIQKTLDNPTNDVGVGYSFNIYDDTNALVSTITTDEKGYAVTELLPQGQYRVEEVKKEGFEVVEPFNVLIDENDRTYTFDLVNEVETGRISFEKIGDVFTHSDTAFTEMGMVASPVFQVENLVGAEIEIYANEDIIHNGALYYEKDQLVQTLRSELDTVQSQDLPLGKYYYIESKAPLGYVPSTVKHEFELNVSAQILDLDLLNERPMLNVNFIKELEQDVNAIIDEEAYNDVVYGIYAREDLYTYHGSVGTTHDTLMYTTGIDEKGSLANKIDLPVGSYYLKELATNEAYTLDTKEYDFVIEPTSEEINNIVINEGTPVVNNLKDYQVRVNKIDSSTKQAVKTNHFEFTMYSDEECTIEVQHISADVENGTATFKGVHFGNYYIKETKAPKGYELSKEVKHLEINETGLYVNGNKVESDEDMIYSFEYENTLLASLSTNDTSNTNLYLSIGFMSLFAIAIVLFKKKARNK